MSVIFEQFYLGCLAHASYLVGSSEAGSEGVAAVVDPQRDVGLYLAEAAARGLRIAYIIETHLHADFVSGHLELADRTGAQILIGAAADVKFPHRPMHDGDEIRFGRCVLKFLTTPGHTLESLCITVADLDRGEEPFAVLTGDTLFIGDVGRPDLSPEHSPQQLAAMLHDSLHNKLMRLADAVEVWPAHGAGSLCGRQMGTDRSSTIGRERQFNYALQAKSKEEFVTLLTADLPERPGYFARDAEINRSGARPLTDVGPLPVVEVVPDDALLLDVRSPQEYCAGHVRGSLNVGLSGQFASWAGRLIGLDRGVVLLAEDEDRVDEARLRLTRVGIEDVIGYLPGLPVQGLAQTPWISPSELAAHPDHRVLDVRNDAEFTAGHIEGATHIPLDALAARARELDPASTWAVHCKSGYRSTIACSILERAGFPAVENLSGGYDAWLLTRA